MQFKVNLNQPMSKVVATLNNYPIKTRLSLTGTLIVARDIAHAKLKERLDKGEGLPQYLKDYPVYYAGNCLNCDSLKFVNVSFDLNLL